MVIAFGYCDKSKIEIEAENTEQQNRCEKKMNLYIGKYFSAVHQPENCPWASFYTLGWTTPETEAPSSMFRSHAMHIVIVTFLHVVASHFATHDLLIWPWRVILRVHYEQHFPFGFALRNSSVDSSFELYFDEKHLWLSSSAHTQRENPTHPFPLLWCRGTAATPVPFPRSCASPYVHEAEDKLEHEHWLKRCRGRDNSLPHTPTERGPQASQIPALPASSILLLLKQQPHKQDTQPNAQFEFRTFYCGT